MLRKYCKENGISYDKITEIVSLQQDLMQSLIDLGFLSSVKDGLSEVSSCNNNSRKTEILTAALCAGFYPQLARVMKPPKRFVETIGGAIERNSEARFYIYKTYLKFKEL